MAIETSVERQFRFQCSCGATTVSGEKTVTCIGCGAHLGIRRVRRQRQRQGSVAYYGSRTLPVRRVERHRQQPGIAAPVEAQAIPHKVWVDANLTSVESDFEDHPGDAPHGGFIILLLLPLIVLIALFYRSCVGG